MQKFATMNIKMMIINMKIMIMIMVMVMVNLVNILINIDYFFILDLLKLIFIVQFNLCFRIVFIYNIDQLIFNILIKNYIKC